MTSSILLAARNARTLRWLSGQCPEMLDLMRETYASDLGIPVAQVNRSFESNEELSWVYQAFAAEIDELTRAGKPLQSFYRAPSLSS